MYFCEIQNLSTNSELENLLAINNVEDKNLVFLASVNNVGQDNIEELIPGGKNIKVVEQNKHQYIKLCAKWILINSVREKIENLLTGIYDIIPRQYFGILDEKEMDTLLCGAPKIDIKDWKEHTIYYGYSCDDEMIKWFWKIVNEMEPAVQVDSQSLYCLNQNRLSCSNLSQVRI